MATLAKPNQLSAQQRHARKTLKSLKKERYSKDSVSLMISKDSSPIPVPSDAVEYLEQILEFMANGKPVKFIQDSQQLTTQQAADYMNVSRPHIVKLMETGVLPFTKVGKHRRIDFNDLHTYHTTQKERARKALQKLADSAQELDMGY
jgi:excisionase family DNA binding protein